jgi:hypothetical protein
MPIFISYSHEDAAFVNKLAPQLVKRNAHVWIDSWELNVGDSILGRVQEAIQDSSALLVVLSRASVASQWCKKELNAGLMRELDEKRVLVLPILVEDCEIPMFLREKMYADFRRNFDVGLKALVEAVAKVTSLDQGRIQSGKGAVDWAEDWSFGDDGLLSLTYTLVESSPDWAYSFLTEITAKCNGEATRRYVDYAKHGMDWVGRMVIAEILSDFANSHELRLLLEDQFPKVAKYLIRDSGSEAEYDVIVRCRRIGEDNGKDQLINAGNYLLRIREQVRKIARKLTPEEKERIKEIARSHVGRM